MATGIGKTRLMGASIYYLYKTKGYKHFFILAPGNTIYDKLRKESNPNHPKYIFKGLEAEMGRPKVYDGENYDTYPVKFEQMSLRIEKTSEIQLFIFNIGKIFNSKTDTQFNFHKFKETLGASFADVLAQFDDLVICMDEAHRYYAPASMKAINYLKPVLGLEFTATPKTTSNVIYAYDLARGAVEGYLKIPVVMGRSNMAGYNQDDIEEMKIRDGLMLHEHRKAVLREYCSDNDLDCVKPIVLIACKDTDHAKKIRALIDSDDFQKGKYKGKVIEIHSKQSGEESEENIRLLLSIESASNPIEIVLHVYKLKEGWDVNNLFTIIPLNAAKSDILAMQTIGRGLRLPFGEQTGNEDLDSLDIVAHDHYRELVDEIKSSDIFRYRDLDKTTVEPSESVGVSATVDDGQLSLLDFAITASGVKSFAEVSNPKTQLEIYQEYVKNFNHNVEITSRMSSYKIPEKLNQLEITCDSKECLDTAIATNMIAVGMDVDRLGLMVVTGQPKQNSEYIQATSRIGRAFPGLVVTLYNAYRPRDLSHYENFTGYHSQLYRFVEGTTATPFSARARDRVMHALVISAIRLNFPNMANNPDAAAIGSLTKEQLDSVKSLIIDRLNIIKPSARTDAEEEIDRFIDWWKLQAAQTKPLRYYVVGTERYNRLMNPYDQPHDENEKATLRSMREVESSANMFYYTEE